MKSIVLSARLFIALVASLPAAAHADVTGNFVGHDGLAHVVDARGREHAARREVGQVGVSALRASADRQSVGWLVEERNCCTSYPIALRLAVRRAGHSRIISDGFMIYDWACVGGGREVALSTGVVHGAMRRTLSLYDVRTGRRVASWIGDFNAPPPAWAKALER